MTPREKTLTAIALVLAIVVCCIALFGCGSTQMATYGSALSGGYARPMPYYAYQPEPWRSLYVVPQTRCVFQRNVEVCRPI